MSERADTSVEAKRGVVEILVALGLLGAFGWGMECLGPSLAIEGLVKISANKEVDFKVAVGHERFITEITPWAGNDQIGRLRFYSFETVGSISIDENTSRSNFIRGNSAPK